MGPPGGFSQEKRVIRASGTTGPCLDQVLQVVQLK